MPDPAAQGECCIASAVHGDGVEATDLAIIAATDRGQVGRRRYPGDIVEHLPDEPEGPGAAPTSPRVIIDPPRDGRRHLGRQGPGNPARRYRIVHGNMIAILVVVGTDDKSPAAGRLIRRPAIDVMPGVLPDVRVSAIATVMTARSRGGRGMITDGPARPGWPPISPPVRPQRDARYRADIRGRATSPRGLALLQVAAPIL
jgi:hypothetical protein